MRSATDLVTILERVDSAERWVLTFQELDAGLRRLSESGRIRQTATGRFFRTDPGKSHDPYLPLTQEQYAAAVRRYRTSFADGVVRMARSWPLRSTVSVFRAMHRLTRGRLGLPPGSVDLDAVAVAFAAEPAVIAAGGSVGDLERGEGWLRVPVVNLRPETGRAALVAAVGNALRRNGLTGRRVILQFDDGEERDAIPD